MKTVLKAIVKFDVNFFLKTPIHHLMLHGLSVGFALALFASNVQAQEDVEQGKLLFESRCPVCHQLPEPSMLTLDQWRHSIKTMQKRMQSLGLSPLTETEFQQLLAYLVTQARD